MTFHKSGVSPREYEEACLFNGSHTTTDLVYDGPQFCERNCKRPDGGICPRRCACVAYSFINAFCGSDPDVGKFKKHPSRAAAKLGLYFKSRSDCRSLRILRAEPEYLQLEAKDKNYSNPVTHIIYAVNWRNRFAILKQRFFGMWKTRLWRVG